MIKMKRKGMSVKAIISIIILLAVILIGVAFIDNRSNVLFGANERYSIPFQPIIMSFDEKNPVTDIVGEAIVLKSGEVTIRGFDITKNTIKIDAESNNYYVLRLDLSKDFFKDRDIDPKKALVYNKTGEIYCGDITNAEKCAYYDPDNNFIYVNTTGDFGIIVKNTVFDVKTGCKDEKEDDPEYNTEIGCDLEDKTADPYCFVEGTNNNNAVNTEGTEGIEDIPE